MDDLDRSHQRYMQDPEYAAEYERLKKEVRDLSEKDLEKYL